MKVKNKKQMNPHDKKHIIINIIPAMFICLLGIGLVIAAFKSGLHKQVMPINSPSEIIILIGLSFNAILALGGLIKLKVWQFPCKRRCGR